MLTGVMHRAQGGGNIGMERVMFIGHLVWTYYLVFPHPGDALPATGVFRQYTPIAKAIIALSIGRLKSSVNPLSTHVIDIFSNRPPTPTSIML